MKLLFDLVEQIANIGNQIAGFIIQNRDTIQDGILTLRALDDFWNQPPGESFEVDFIRCVDDPERLQAVLKKTCQTGLPLHGKFYQRYRARIKRELVERADTTGNAVDVIRLQVCKTNIILASSQAGETKLEDVLQDMESGTYSKQIHQVIRREVISDLLGAEYRHPAHKQTQGNESGSEELVFFDCDRLIQSILNPSEYKIFTLNVYQSMTARDIASKLDKTPEAIKKQLQRSKNKLKAAFPQDLLNG